MDENNKEAFNESNKMIERGSHKSTAKFIIIFVVICGVLWLAYNLLTSTFGVGPTQITEDSIPCISGPGIMCPDDGYTGRSYNSLERSISISKNSNYYQDQTPTIEDTREFIKMSYNSTIKTRKVSEIVTNVKNIIAGADGRVDSFNSSEKRGYISFVVDKDKFEDLRSQVAKLVNAKLYVENISGQNLLSQKQNIEEQATATINTLESLKNQLASLEKSHTQNVSAINKQLSSIRSQLTSVRASIAVTTDPTIMTSLRSQETLLMQQESTQNTKLGNENKSYNSQKQNLNNDINAWNNNLTYVSNQDMQFTNNVETVNGYITVSWISYWDMAKLFSPIHPLLIIIILIFVSWLPLRHKKIMPKVVIE